MVRRRPLANRALLVERQGPERKVVPVEAIVQHAGLVEDARDAGRGPIAGWALVMDQAVDASFDGGPGLEPIHGQQGQQGPGRHDRLPAGRVLDVRAFETAPVALAPATVRELPGE